MRCTRRVLDRQIVAALLAGAGVVGSVVSCSSADDPVGADSADAATESSNVSDGPSNPTDAGVDGSDASRDAGPFDGSVPPIVCQSASCATSLTTTRGLFSKDYNNLYIEDPAEGFCALLHDRTVACWGANGKAQLGRGDDAGVDDSLTPARVVGVSNVVALDHTCALDSAGSISCWGTGPFLRDGLGYVSTERTPVQLPLPPATSMSVGFRTGCAIASGSLTCWGANDTGQVATTPSTGTYSPIDIVLPAGAALRDVHVGGATFVVRQDGTTVSWGANPPLGRTSSLFPDPYPKPVDLGIFQLDVAYQDACAIAGGIGYCWGVSGVKEYYELSLPRLGHAIPEAIVMPELVRQIATTDTTVGYVNYVLTTRQSRQCAIGVSGAVYCVGDNTNGQVGDGTKEYAFDPVKVNLPAAAVEVKVMPTTTCALLTTGQVFCWGSNFYGQLGSGKPKVPSLVPQEVVFQ